MAKKKSKKTSLKGPEKEEVCEIFEIDNFSMFDDERSVSIILMRR